MLFLIILLFAGVMLWGAFISSRFEWMAADTPTVPTGSPIAGQLEVTGVAGVAPNQAIVISPLSGTRCVWWSYSVHRFVKNSQGEKKQETLISGLSMPWVTVDDGSGPFEVRFPATTPTGATDKTFEHNELPPGLTCAQLASHGVDRKETMPDLNDKAAKWLARLTTSIEELGPRGNVPIANMDEGYSVKETFIAEGQTIYALGKGHYNEEQHRVIMTLGHDNVSQIHVGSEKEFLKSKRNLALGLFVGALLLCWVAFAVLFGAQDSTKGAWVRSLIGPAFVVVIAIGSQLVRARNRVVIVCEQHKAADGLIDIALKKRSTLIPQLNEVVRAAAQHEASTHTMVASMSLDGIDTRSLAMLQQASPSLKVNENFLQLQRTLSGVETDVAAARGFKAEAESIYRTRIQTFPDGLLARLTGVKITLTEAPQAS
jgi:LemA protein